MILSGIKSNYNKMRTITLALIVTATVAVGGFALTNGSEAHAASSCKSYTYRQGSGGSCVKYIQQIVNASQSAGTISTDGAFGPKTKAAVVSFQKSRGIGADGVVGPQTWGKLCSVTQSAARAAKSAAGCGGSSSTARAKGWTRVFTNNHLNISACDAGSNVRLRFELGSSRTSVSSVYVGNLGIKTGLHKYDTYTVGKATWGDGTYNVQAWINGKWTRLGSVYLNDSNVAICQ